MNKKGHIGIFGMSESGKTTLLIYLAKALKRKNPERKLIVLDPMMDIRWDEGEIRPDFLTHKSEAFITYCKNPENKSGICVMDEGAGENKKFDDGILWTTTKGRHWGHKFLICAQSGVQWSPTVRGQLSHVYLFATNKRGAEIWYEQYNAKEAFQVSDRSWPQYQFLKLSRYSDPLKGKLKISENLS